MSISRYILPFIIVVLSGLMYVVYIGPTYQGIIDLGVKKIDFKDAISKAEEVRNFQAKLLAEVQTIDPRDGERLEKILPPSHDAVLALYDLNVFAQKHGLLLKSPTVTISTEVAGVDTSKPHITEVTSKFSVSAPYSVFRTFVADLERELAIRDIQTLSIRGSGEGGALFDGSVFIYQMEIKGYAYEEKETKSAGLK